MHVGGFGPILRCFSHLRCIIGCFQTQARLGVMTTEREYNYLVTVYWLDMTYY